MKKESMLIFINFLMKKKFTIYFRKWKNNVIFKNSFIEKVC